MPSLLSRVVFRSLLTSRPIIFSGCLRRTQRGWNPHVHGGMAVLGPKSLGFQKRTFWEDAEEEKPRRKRPNLYPGFGEMMELSKLLRLNARLPSPEKVARAFERFFKAMDELLDQYPDRHNLFEDFHAVHILKALRYIQKHQPQNGQPLISGETLYAALRATSKLPPSSRESHQELAKELFHTLCQRGTSDDARNYYVGSKALLYFFLTLRTTPLEAREMLLTWQKNPPKWWRDQLDLRGAWMQVIHGLEDNEEELLKTASLPEFAKTRQGNDVRYTLLNLYIRHGDVEKAKRNFVPGDSWKMSYMRLRKVLEACVKSSALEFGKSIVQDLTSGEEPTNLQWANIFYWAAAIGKSPEEIDRMMDVMARRMSDGKPPSWPKIMWSIVSPAVERNDPYLAERFVSLAEKRGVQSSQVILSLQIQYRIASKDIDGARAAYSKLQEMEYTSADGIENPTVKSINELLQAMCASESYDFDVIMEIADDLSKRKARFEPETVVALCHLHLQRDEFYDVVDLLQTHSFRYSIAQRAYIAQALVSVCLDPAHDVARAWDTYMITQDIFDEIDRSQRTKIMQSFFQRNRPDMGVHVFNHMRMHSRVDTRADADTYIAAFVGIAQCGDEESLENVHNQLKLDYDVDPSTRLSNALMLAYTGCKRADEALNFWDDIVGSREGPSYASIRIMFHACERSHFGDRKAPPLWAKLRQMDIEVTPDLFASYLGALAGNQLFQEAMKALESCEEELGLKPDAVILGTMFNATRFREQQRQLGPWMKEKFPDAWAELEKMGSKDFSSGRREFLVEVPLDP